MILITPLMSASQVLAAYEKYAPGDSVTISEFVYNDDYTPYTSDCTLAVYNPAGEAFSLPGGATMSKDDATGRHYKTFTPDSTAGIWPATMSCGVAGTDKSNLDKTFVVGYTDVATDDIANAVWTADDRELTSFGTLVSDIATAVWSSLNRTLTSRQIGVGEYIAGVSANYLVTQVASETQATNIQSDVTTTKNNVATLINEIGSGQISAIKTKTDTINWTNVTDIKTKTDTISWSDVTGIVTTAGQIKTKTDTIDWTNVTAIKTKTDTISWSDITSVVTNTGEIKAKTDTIAWDDITGIVTSTGEIKTKTDTIDWTNVTAIKTKTDTISWDDVTGIKAATDTIDWSDVTGIRSSQVLGWTVTLSDFGQAEAGTVYRAKLQVLNYETVPTDAFATPTLTIYDANGIAIAAQTDQPMVKDSAGTYHYYWTIPTDTVSGVLETDVSVQVESGKIAKVNDYWEVYQGSPTMVVVNSVTDTIGPEVSANVTIVNEGANWYEYHYEWCVMTSSTDDCSGGGTVYGYGYASKLIDGRQSYNITLSADNLPSAGTYYFKTTVFYGSEESSAIKSFVATMDEEEEGGGGGGGGGGGSGSADQGNGAGFKSADLNLDGFVNAIDFSILLAFWKTNPPYRFCRTH